MGQRTRNFDNPLSAFLTVLRDRRDTSDTIEPSSPTERLEGRTCLVTGANSGLGRAIAFELARRDASLILAIRRNGVETADAIKAATGNTHIQTLPVNLADLRSVDTFIETLSEHTTHIDRLILNAGLMASTARETPQGYEEMFAVHYLANYLLITRLTERGLLAPAQDGMPARVIAISSEAHRSGLPISKDTFGEIHPHTFNSALKQYGHTKLAMSLMISGLSHRYLKADGSPQISFFQTSPGPVATQIARSAPHLLRPLSKLLLPVMFASPDKACAPAIYLTCSPDMDNKTDLYMHLMRFKQPSADAQNSENKAFVLEFAEAACNQLPNITN